MTTSAVMARSNTPRQLLPKDSLAAILGLEYSEVTAELDHLFEMQTSEAYKEEMVMMVGTGLAPTKSEGGVFFYDSARETYVAKAEHETVALGFQLTEEQIDDNRHKKLSEVMSKFIGRSMAQTKELKKANVLNNAFNASFTNGPEGDGVALISASHPTLTDGNHSNLLTGDISETALESSFISIMKAKDDRGILINLRAKGLTVPVDSYFSTYRILNANGQTGNNYNDPNAIRDTGMLPGGLKTSSRLTDTDSWFITTNLSDPGLLYYQRKPMRIKTDGDFETGNFKFQASERYHVGSWGNFRAIYGSAGV